MKLINKVLKLIYETWMLFINMDAIFINSENYETSDPQRLVVDIADKIKIKKEVTNILY